MTHQEIKTEALRLFHLFEAEVYNTLCLHKNYIKTLIKSEQYEKAIPAIRAELSLIGLEP